MTLTLNAVDRRLLRSIIALSVPAVVTNITTPLLALCDVAITGHLGSAVYIAAIAVGGTMFNMLYWLCGFLRMGSSGTTARQLGAGDMEGAYAIGLRALGIGLTLGVLMIGAGIPLCDLLLGLVDARGEVKAIAATYFKICIFGAPAVLGTFAMTGWCIGMQDTRIPMWVSVFVNLLNIAVSISLVYGAGMKITGVAMGTLTAQWAGFILGLVMSLRRYGMIRVSRRRVLDLGELKSFFRINTDIFLRTLCLVAVTLWFTRVGASQGTVMLAVNTLLMQLFTIFSYMMDGLAYAGEAMCGRLYGASDRMGLKRTVRALFRIGFIVSTVFTVCYVLFGAEFLHLLSSEGEVTERSEEYIGWAACIPLVSFMAFVGDGVMIGLSRTRLMLGSMIAGAVTFFILYLWLFPEFGNHGLWVAFLSYLLVRGVVFIMTDRHIRPNMPHRLRKVHRTTPDRNAR